MSYLGGRFEKGEMKIERYFPSIYSLHYNRLIRDGNSKKKSGSLAKEKTIEGAIKKYGKREVKNFLNDMEDSGINPFKSQPKFEETEEIYESVKYRPSSISEIPSIPSVVPKTYEYSIPSSYKTKPLPKRPIDYSKKPLPSIPVKPFDYTLPTIPVKPFDYTLPLPLPEKKLHNIPYLNPLEVSKTIYESPYESTGDISNISLLGEVKNENEDIMFLIKDLKKTINDGFENNTKNLIAFTNFLLSKQETNPYSEIGDIEEEEDYPGFGDETKFSEGRVVSVYDSDEEFPYQDFSK